MGKAAQNERIKLRATYWNSLSIGLFLGALLFGAAAPATYVSEVQLVLRLLALALAVALALYFRSVADREIQKIQD